MAGDMQAELSHNHFFTLRSSWLSLFQKAEKLLRPDLGAGILAGGGIK
jgi:hypothetical protein